MIFLSILAILSFLSSVSAIDVTNITTNNNTGIKGAIEITDDNGEINLAHGIYSGENNTNISINKNLTFIGHGDVILDGKRNGRLFLIIENSPLNVKFINISFINGNTGNRSGGAIYSTNNHLTFIDCNFVNNSARNGGAIYNSYSDYCIIKNSKFINNTAIESGTIYTNVNNLHIKNSIFINNCAKNNSGGAIFNNGDNFFIENSTFINNFAYGSGGAVYNLANNFTTKNTIFNNNSGADGSGGAIYSSFEHDFQVYNSIFMNNNAVSGGGGIYTKNGINFIVKNSIFHNNFATYSGGAILHSNGNNFLVENSSFTSNIVSYFGGGAIYSFENNITIKNSLFDNNSANTNGGAIYNIFGDNFTVFNSSFNNNSVGYNGGAIYSEGYNTNIQKSTFTFNSANFGGGIYLSYSSNISINYNRFYNNVNYDLYNEQSSNIDADFNWWGYNNISNKMYKINTTNHYILVIFSEKDLNNITFKDKVYFKFLVLNTTNNSTTNNSTINNSKSIGDLAILNGKGELNNNTFNISSKELFEKEILIDNGGLQVLKVSLDGEEAILEFNALKKETGIILNPISNTRYLNTVLIKGILTDKDVIDKDNNCLNGTVVLIVNDEKFNVDLVNGRYSLKYKTNQAGSHKVIAIYSGNNNYSQSNTTLTFTINKRITYTYHITNQILTNGYNKFTATVKDNLGNYLAGRTVKFYLNNYYITSSKTNSKGIATIYFKSPITTIVKVKAVFAGDNNYLSSTKFISTKIYNKIIYLQNIKSIEKDVLTIKSKIYNIGSKKANFKIYFKLPKNSYLITANSYIIKSSYKYDINYNKEKRTMVLKFLNLKPDNKPQYGMMMRVKVPKTINQRIKVNLNTKNIKLLTNSKY
jgi:predicted outer membrane repeat protein